MTSADKFGIAFSVGFTVAILAIALSFSAAGKAAPAPVVPTTPAPVVPTTPPAPAETPAPAEQPATPPAEEAPAEQPPAEQAPTEETPAEEPAPTEEAPTEEPMGDMIMSLDITISKGASSPGCETDGTCFVESDAMVSTGGTVTWTNDDSAAHTVTSGTPTDGPDGVFDSSIIMAGKTFEFTFDKAGEYNYFCVVHPWMTGKVTVE